MKALSLQQPWASLVVGGMKDLDNRTWAPRAMPRKLLIHASKRITEATFEKNVLEFVQETYNHMLFGNLPDFEHLPAGAIIGYVTLKSVDHNNADSVWAMGESGDPDLFFWHFEDAYVFDKPIMNVKGSLNLWDFPLDEDNLPPAHKVVVNRPKVKGDEIYIPMTHEDFKDIDSQHQYGLGLSLSLESLLVAKDGRLRPFKKINFVCQDEVKTFVLKAGTELRFLLDDNGEPYLSDSLFNAEGEKNWFANFVW